VDVDDTVAEGRQPLLTQVAQYTVDVNPDNS
jgi:hypothetical protein